MARPKGTPDKLNPTVVKAICESLEIGFTAALSAEVAGISSMTFFSWLRKGAQETEPYASFVHDVMVSRAKGAKLLWIRAISGGTNSGAARWALERRFRKEFGANAPIEDIAHPDPTDLRDDLKLAEEARKSSEAVRAMHEALERTIAKNQKPKRPRRGGP